MDYQTQTPATMNFTASVVAAGTTTTLSQTNAATYAILGKIYAQSAAWSNQATPTVDFATGNAFVPVLANQGSIYLIGLDHSKAMHVTQGQVQALDVNGNFITAPMFGGLGPVGSGTTDNDFCPIAYLVIKAGSTANATTGWIFGTSNNSGVTGITYTFVDIANMPNRPQVS